MFVFRVSSAFVVVVLLFKTSLFVADDSKFIEVESLGAIEKRVSKLIDESLRDLREEKEREEEGAELSFAARFVSARKEIMRCVDGVCQWAHRTVQSFAASVSVAVFQGAGRVEPNLERLPQGYLPIKPNPVAIA